MQALFFGALVSLALTFPPAALANVLVDPVSVDQLASVIPAGTYAGKNCSLRVTASAENYQIVVDPAEASDQEVKAVFSVSPGVSLLRCQQLEQNGTYTKCISVQEGQWGSLTFGKLPDGALEVSIGYLAGEGYALGHCVVLF